MEEIRSYIPHVVGAITAAAREVIRAGAVNVVVPGNFKFPVGCFPLYLTSFPVKDPKAYDDKGRLKHLNEFAMDHNNQLQVAIALRKEFPHACGYSLRRLLQRVSYTFYVVKDSTHEKRPFGAVGVPVCQNPDKFISWDGVHLTQKAYRFMSKFLNNQILSQIKCTRA